MLNAAGAPLTPEWIRWSFTEHPGRKPAWGVRFFILISRCGCPAALGEDSPCRSPKDHAEQQGGTGTHKFLEVNCSRRNKPLRAEAAIRLPDMAGASVAQGTPAPLPTRRSMRLSPASSETTLTAAMTVREVPTLRTRRKNRKLGGSRNRAETQATAGIR